jgi:Beta-lactamase
VGRTWHEAGDGEWMRAALPFSLMEVNENCLHHGVLTFAFSSAGRASRVAYQVSSETCAYFKADLWGFLQAELLDVTLPDAGRVVEERRAELGGRLPRRSLAQLAVDYPGANPAEFGHPAEVTPLHMSTWGVIADGVHYSGGCPTRAGEYPFCAELVLPSYSVAKSVFGSLGLMRLERRFPGVRNQEVAEYVPECAAKGGWSGVTFENLLDMSSGHWTSAAAYADEDSVAMSKAFFEEPRHAGKIAYACGHSPRRETAGRSFVYRTSDTYVLGAALAGFVRKKMGPRADLLDDVVWPDVWRVAGLSPVADFSRRTRDHVRQPFVGFGLTLLPDDVAKLGQWLNPLSASAQDLLDARMLRSALQLDAADRGLATSADGTLLYNDGFWAMRIDYLPGCDAPVFVPYMSGFGGVTIALLPDGVTYYYFSDGNEFRFRRAVYAAARLHPYCRTATASPPVVAKEHAS